MMVLHPAKPLFDWEELEDSPSLQTIKDLLATLPDGKLLDSLRRARGKGRNDYAVHVLWGVVVLRVALRHVTTEATLGELRRNEGLRRLIDIESEARVPKPWNISRFEEVLGQEPHRSLLKDVFDVLIRAWDSRSPTWAGTPPATPPGCRRGASRGRPPRRRSTRDCRRPAAVARNTRMPRGR